MKMNMIIFDLFRNKGCPRSSRCAKFWNQGTSGAIGAPRDARLQGNMDAHTDRKSFQDV